MLIYWVIVFIASLAILIKGADWLLESAEKIGLALGLSPFIIGVTIVGLGTSFPELISAMMAMLQGVTEIVCANAIGSNIANILLVVGISAILGRKIIIKKSLIDLDLPLLAISTAILLGIVWDMQVTFFESVLLLLTYIIYLFYTVLHKDDEILEGVEPLPSRQTRRGQDKKDKFIEKIEIKDFVFLLLGIVFLFFGAKYLIDSVINLSEILKIGVGVITITAVALGTSLPELFVSARAAFQKKSEVALGNIFGSNVFNALVVIGLPGLFKTLAIDEQTFFIGIPTMAMATLLFIISGISRRIYIWEGTFFLILYILFTAKLFGLF